MAELVVIVVVGAERWLFLDGRRLLTIRQEKVLHSNFEIII